MHMTLDGDEAIQVSKRRHEREVLLQIVLPMALGVLVIALVMIALVALPRLLQVSIVADFTLTLFVLCPLALCTLPLTIALATVAMISGRAHPALAKPLRRGEAWSLKLRGQATRLLERIGKASIRFRVFTAPAVQWMRRTFRPSPVPKPDDEVNK
jgi:hypothetical protein